MKSGFNEEELRNIKNKKILKILGFEFDNDYDLIRLNGAGAWIENVPVDKISLDSMKDNAKISEIMERGGMVTISHPLPLDNGYPLSKQRGVYCTNYKEVFLSKEDKEEKNNHMMVL